MLKMLGKTALALTLVCFLVVLFTGCAPSESELSKDELVAKLVDAMVEDQSDATDIRVLKHSSVDRIVDTTGKVDDADLVLYYYKIGQDEFEDLKFYAIKNNKVVLFGGSINKMIVDEEELTYSGTGSQFDSKKGPTDIDWFVYGHRLNPGIATVEVDFTEGKTKSQEIDELGGYIVHGRFENFVGVKEVRGLDSEGNILYRFPPEDNKVQMFQ